MTVRRSSWLTLGLVSGLVYTASALVACGGKIDDPTGNTNSNVHGDPAPVDTGPHDPPAPKLTVGPGCTSQAQGGATSCKSADTWRTYAAQACKDGGLVLGDQIFLESCSPGTDMWTTTQYTCCSAPPPPPPTDVDAGPPDPGSPCPAKATDVPLGSPCTEPLVCDYVDACGNVDEYHCKYGTWQMNTWTYCAGK